MEEQEKVISEEKNKDIRYFFDTYAIIEILKENPAYALFKEKPITITLFNLGEIYFYALRELADKAESLYSLFRKVVVEIDDETLKEAMKFKKEKNKRDVSYTDSIGYIYAKRHNMRFLTGDPQFEHLENVEFVK